MLNRSDSGIRTVNLRASYRWTGDILRIHIQEIPAATSIAKAPGVFLKVSPPFAACWSSGPLLVVMVGKSWGVFF